MIHVHGTTALEPDGVEGTRRPASRPEAVVEEHLELATLGVVAPIRRAIAPLGRNLARAVWRL